MLAEEYDCKGVKSKEFNYGDREITTKEFYYEDRETWARGLKSGGWGELVN